jgi:hypothetical protein
MTKDKQARKIENEQLSPVNGIESPPSLIPHNGCYITLSVLF